jgi:hypothetical protein
MICVGWGMPSNYYPVFPARSCQKTHGNRGNVENNVKILAIAVLLLLTLELAQAEPREKHERNKNYIIRRQQAGSVTGVPTIRRIRGSREIDIYRNGMMFEKDNLVGVRGGTAQ